MAGTQPQPAETEAQLLSDLAAKYLWWLDSATAAEQPDRVLVQVMNIGDYDDVLTIVQRFGEPRLAQVLQRSQAGQLNPRSWHYWHYRLGLARPGEVPPMPERSFG